ncbi:hypothetical protein BDW75DRAFT_126301 [Aspergillus navahoensis]
MLRAAQRQSYNLMRLRLMPIPGERKLAITGALEQCPHFRRALFQAGGLVYLLIWSDTVGMGWCYEDLINAANDNANGFVVVAPYGSYYLFRHAQVKDQGLREAGRHSPLALDSRCPAFESALGQDQKVRQRPIRPSSQRGNNQKGEQTRLLKHNIQC